MFFHVFSFFYRHFAQTFRNSAFHAIYDYHMIYTVLYVYDMIYTACMIYDSCMVSGLSYDRGMVVTPARSVFRTNTRVRVPRTSVSTLRT